MNDAWSIAREWGGELEYAVEARTTPGLAAVLRPYKRDRHVLVTAPVWAVRVGKLLLKGAWLSNPQAKLVLAWCALSEVHHTSAKTFERAAAVAAVIDLAADPTGGHIVATEHLRKMLGLTLEEWRKPLGHARAEMATFRERWKEQAAP